MLGNQEGIHEELVQSAKLFDLGSLQSKEVNCDAVWVCKMSCNVNFKLFHGMITPLYICLSKLMVSNLPEMYLQKPFRGFYLRICCLMV